MNMFVNSTGASGIWASAALLLLLIAPAIFFISDETGERIKALREHGMVMEAKVVGKRRVEKPYTDSKGRSKTNNATYVDIQYDPQTSLKYKEWLANGEKTPALKLDAPLLTYAYPSTNEEFDAMNPGDRVTVVINRYARTRAEMAAFVKAYSNTTLFLAAGLCGLLGLICALVAWRTRPGR